MTQSVNVCFWEKSDLNKIKLKLFGFVLHMFVFFLWLHSAHGPRFLWWSSVSFCFDMTAQGSEVISVFLCYIMSRQASYSVHSDWLLVAHYTPTHAFPRFPNHNTLLHPTGACMSFFFFFFTLLTL